MGAGSSSNRIAGEAGHGCRCLDMHGIEGLAQAGRLRTQIVRRRGAQVSMRGIIRIPVDRWGRAHLFAVDGDTRITSVKPTPRMVQRR